MRPKILLFFEYATLNGGEFSLLAMLDGLGQMEFEFVAAAPISGPLAGRLTQLGILVYPLMLRDAGGQKRSLEEIDSHLVDLVTQVSPDLVHANSLAMGRMVGRIAPRLSVPCTSHLRDIIKLNKTVVSDLNQHAGLIAVSHATRQFHAAQGMRLDALQVIHNGVDAAQFLPGPATGMLKQALGLSRSALLVANIGQICLRKGQTVLAEAAVALADACPEAHYLFIGERHSQKTESVTYEQTIRLIFRDAGIEDRLFCLGFRNDVPSILNDVDLLAHAAHQEPLGRVLLEAAACGKAIVATDVGGTREILTDQVSALLVHPGEAQSLAAAMQRVLTDQALRMRLGEQARIRALEKFSLATATAEVRAFWRSFL
ncbi:MAG: glycosyltransferase family 4 protein [Planctomycetes bacterium]|nr:glycosyltransferase family 4 protein [Planctomycetota bacterium]